MFQKMLVNNLESTIKVFFRGMSTLRVKSVQSQKSSSNLKLNLNDLERAGIVETRVRKETKVKQFCAGHLFEYLKDNIRLKSHQCLLVLTNADLYPKEGWTFVFGMTKPSWRICIQSYARHHPDFAKPGAAQ